MGKVLIEEQNLIDIADSIREKTGSTDTMLPSEMSDNIKGIESVNGLFNTTYSSKDADVYQYWMESYYLNQEDLPPITILPNSFTSTISLVGIKHLIDISVSLADKYKPSSFQALQFHPQIQLYHEELLQVS